MSTTNNYDYISEKIDSLKKSYSYLRNKSDDFAFSALCVKSDYYKNPALDFNDQIIEDMMVDGPNDGGVDAIFTDPNSDTSNLVLVQSKYHERISYEEIVNAINKLVEFYNEMDKGSYNNYHDKVVSRFSQLNAEIGDESKVIFEIYTSAPKNNIKYDKLNKYFLSRIKDTNKFELKVSFDNDICEEIKESESRRPDVEFGKLNIDEAGNYLSYNDDEAIIANVSAMSIKKLYASNGVNLLAKNLRYHIAGKNIDDAIKNSIKENPEEFWFKNNGLTIICDEFNVSGKEIKLKHFSIVNGGQTTFNLYKSNYLDEHTDFYLPCKIITSKGDTTDEKNKFSLEIAKATNSQKAIKSIDLKANSPEQIRFANEMKNNGIFYQTKRGETVDKRYKLDYLNTDLTDTGKLCLAGIFQLPCASRNKPSMIYNQEFYEVIFNSNQNKIAKISKQLLYIDYYFRKLFIKKYVKDNENNPLASDLIPVANNSRTICIAFTALACRYKNGNLGDKKMKDIFESIKKYDFEKTCYDIFKNLDGFDTLFKEELFNNKDELDTLLYSLFDKMIQASTSCFSMAKNYDQSLNPSNYFKKDANYFEILKAQWSNLLSVIESIPLNE